MVSVLFRIILNRFYSYRSSSMAKRPCNDCLSSKRKLGHRCVRHADCVDRKAYLWKPEDCTECSTRFLICEEDSQEASEARHNLKGLALKIKAAHERSAKDRGEHIFVNEEVRKKFSRKFLIKATTFLTEESHSESN